MRHSERGFTLVEVVAALVLLAIVGIPLANVFMDSFKTQARGQKKTEVNKVAQFVAEQLKDGKNYYGIDSLDLTLNRTVTKKSEDILSDIGTLTEPYDIVIEVKSEEVGQDISGNTPTEFAYTIETDGALFNITEGSAEHSGFSITCSDFIVRTSEDNNQDATYDILIENISDSQEATFQIDKRTPSALNIYTKGKQKVNLKGYPENRLSREYTSFKTFHLGEKDSVSSKSEDLYNATITVTSRVDETIRASMNTTFTIQREKEESV